MCVMKISSVNNMGYTPSGKALYFTKTPTIAIDKGMEFLSHENVSTSKKGIRYLKDDEIPREIRKKLGELPFIKKLSKKYETFVWFVESKTLDTYRSWVKISHVKNGMDYATNHYVVGTSNADQIIARENLYSNIKNKKFLVL